MNIFLIKNANIKAYLLGTVIAFVSPALMANGCNGITDMNLCNSTEITQTGQKCRDAVGHPECANANTCTWKCHYYPQYSGDVGGSSAACHKPDPGPPGGLISCSP